MTDETKHAPAGSQDLLVRRWHGIRLRQYRKTPLCFYIVRIGMSQIQNE